MNESNKYFSWINPKRLRDYPRLMLLVTWSILALNIFFHKGWQGGFGQIIGGDFIMFYATGQIYANSPADIYDYDQQAKIQQSLVSPTVLPGLNPFMNPPFVAPLYSLMIGLPLTWSFIFWTVLMISCALISGRVLMNFVPPEVQKKGLDQSQLLILILSFFPFIESLQAGQNSGLTLLIMTCLIYCIYKEKHLLAGVFAGLMIYKPQYILGFLILWVVWKNIKSLTSFALVTLSWIGVFYYFNGAELFHTYQGLNKIFILLPYMEGFPAYILVTLYGLLSTIFPLSIQPYTYGFTQLVLLGSAIALAIYAFNIRRKPTIEHTPAIALAILLPLVATPYALLHDLVILIPAFVIWTRYHPGRELLIAAIVIYFGTFFFTFISALSHLALNAMLVIGLVISILIRLRKGLPRPVIAVL